MSYRLLIVEDTPALLDAISVFFREKGAGIWEVVTSSNGNDALEKVRSEEFDLMILDIMLPGASGFDICKAARKKGDCPIIFLTALGAEPEIMKGYEIKRAKGEKAAETLSCGAITLNCHTMTVTVNGKEADIKSKEYFLLLYLLENKNAILSRERILEKVWGENFDVNDRIVDNAISRLRTDLGEASKQIKTVIGRGYKITEA